MATPLAFVVEVALAKEPTLDADQVTTRPDVETALPFASWSWATTVTAAPAVGDVDVKNTPYFVAVPVAPALWGPRTPTEITAVVSIANAIP